MGKTHDRGISYFQISGQSLTKENCHNSRTSDDIDMKLGPVTKLNKRNKTMSKNFDNDVISGNCDIVIFWIFSQLEQSLETGFWTQPAKVTVKATFCLTKTENRTKKSLIQLSHYRIEQRYLF